MTFVVDLSMAPGTDVNVGCRQGYIYCKVGSGGLSGHSDCCSYVSRTKAH